MNTTNTSRENIFRAVLESAAFGGAIQVLSLLKKISIDECALEHCEMNIIGRYYSNIENNEKYQKYDLALSPIFK